MRSFAVAASLAALAGCASGPPRTLAPSALIARAWSGREPPTTLRAWSVVRFASAQVGKGYCWGGTGPSCFDCSGLVQRAWATAGVRVPRSADLMPSELNEVRLDEVRAGDVLWWPGHVGIYAGNGWAVEALDSRHGVVRRAAATPYRAFRPEI